MRRLLLILAFLAAAPAFACSCIMPEPLTANELKADDLVVFVGKALKVEPIAKSVADTDPWFLEGNRTTFAVQRHWENELRSEVVVESGPTGGGCGYLFEEGKEYVVFASRDEEQPETLTTSICTRTALLRDASELVEDVKRLIGEGKAVAASSSPQFVYCAPATFANCTVAKCTPKADGSGYTCDCFVDNRYSATAYASGCTEATATTLQSRFHPVAAQQVCTKAPATTPLWAWCLGKPCRKTADGKSAQCDCTAVPSGVQPIPYIVVTGAYLPYACNANPTGVVWSSATPGDVEQITAFLQGQKGLQGVQQPILVKP